MMGKGNIVNKKTFNLLKIIGLFLLIPFFYACDKENVDPDIEPEDVVLAPKGTIEIEFKTPHGPLRPGCVKRAELVLAVNAENLYKGNYLYSFNVSDEQKVYTLDLPPGSYYFQAGLICVCETNSCSAGSYPGGQYGLKYSADKFYITEDETTHVVPSFH